MNADVLAQWYGALGAGMLGFWYYLNWKYQLGNPYTSMRRHSRVIRTAMSWPYLPATIGMTALAAKAMVPFISEDLEVVASVVGLAPIGIHLIYLAQLLRMRLVAYIAFKKQFGKYALAHIVPEEQGQWVALAQYCGLAMFACLYWLVIMPHLSLLADTATAAAIPLMIAGLPRLRFIQHERFTWKTVSLILRPLTPALVMVFFTIGCPVWLQIILGGALIWRTGENIEGLRQSIYGLYDERHYRTYAPLKVAMAVAFLFWTGCLAVAMLMCR